MSYILDALRKADAQRERSRLPGLQAQPRAATREPARPAVPQAMLATTAVVLGLGFAAVAAWQLTRNDDATATAATATAPTALTVAAAPQEPAVAAAASAEEAPPASAVTPAQQILPPAPPPLPAPKPATARLGTAPVSAATASSPPAAAPPATQTPAAAADAVSSTVPAGAPALSVSGGVWSQDPLQRMLIVGGRVFSEGSELAPGVRLQEIRQHRAVLDFRGQRYAVPY